MRNSAYLLSLMVLIAAGCSSARVPRSAGDGSAVPSIRHAAASLGVGSVTNRTAVAPPGAASPPGAGAQTNAAATPNRDTVRNLLAARTALPEQESDPDRAIQPLETIHIDVYGEPDISKDYDVSFNGTINHPLLGKLRVAELDPQEAEERVRQLLAKDYLVNPRVSLRIVKSVSRQVVVFGQVKKPGAYPVSSGQRMTLLNLVSQAGGFTDIAATSRVRIVRVREGTETTLQANIDDLLKGKDGRTDIDLLPGDVITVPETIF